MNIPIKQGGSDSGHWLWFLQRITGIGVLVTIVIHWIIQHIGVENDPINYADVVVRLSQPGYRLLYTLFLMLAVFHGFHGLWMVGRDYLHANWSRTGLAAVLVAASACFFVWGLTILFTGYEITRAAVVP